MVTPFKQTMDGFRAELFDLVKRRNEIETRIVQVSNAIEGLVGVLEDPTEQAKYLDEMRGLTERVGFSSAVRSALALKPNATAVQVRDFIAENRWMDLAAYSNPLASIHTTLRRMKEADEVEENDGKFRLKIDTTHPIHQLKQRNRYAGRYTTSRLNK